MTKTLYLRKEFSLFIPLLLYRRRYSTLLRKRRKRLEPQYFLGTELTELNLERRRLVTGPRLCDLKKQRVTGDQPFGTEDTPIPKEETLFC